MFISTKQIVQKIIRDYNIVNLSFVADTNDWIKEALQYIGTQENKILIKKSFELKDQDLPFPCDLENLIGIVKDGCFINFQNRQGLNTFTETGNIRPYVDGNKIKFNTKEKVTGELYYYGFNYNCDDDILLIDNVYVTSAVTSYIILKLMMRGMKHPVLSYKDAYQIWEKEKAQASNYCAYPAVYEFPFVLSDFPNPVL